MEYHLSPRFYEDFRNILAKEKHILRFGMIKTGETLADYARLIPLKENDTEKEDLIKIKNALNSIDNDDSRTLQS